MNKFTLLIDCFDQKGIVNAVSGFISENNGNIIDSQQYSSGLTAHFFMRVLVDASEFKIKIEDLDSAFSSIAVKFSMNFKFSHHTKRMAILVSKYDHCLYDLLLRKQYGEIHVEIPVIISNHLDLKHVATAFNIPFEYYPIEKLSDSTNASYDSKLNQEAQVINRLQELEIDFIALARYMQILTKEFCQKMSGRIINIHHSFLPGFKGAKPYHQAHARGVKIIGATAHFVTPDLDEGPIIDQDVAHVTHASTPEDLIATGRDIERRVLSRAVRDFAEDRIFIVGDKTVVFHN